MEQQFTFIGVIGLGLSLIVMVFKLWLDRSKEKKEEKKNVDKEIDAISSADDVTRMGDRMRHK